MTPIEQDAQEVIGNLSDEVLQALAGKRLLLTGAAGFLGTHWVEVLRVLNCGPLKETPMTILATDLRLNGGTISTVKMNGITFREWDVRNDLSGGLVEADFIVHLAGIASPQWYRKDPLLALDVAVQGTRNCLKIARECGARILVFSSSEIYGNPPADQIPTKETYRGYVSSMGPRACYDESKRLAETLCYIYHDFYGVSTGIVRPFNVYGPGMKQKDYRMMPNMAGHILRGEPIKVYGDGLQTRTFTYVTDAMNGFIRALVLGRPGEVYNIGQPDPEVNMTQLIRECEAAIGLSIPHECVAYPSEYPQDEPRRRCPDITKAREDLGYVPTVPLGEGFRRFFAWAKEVYT